MTKSELVAAVAAESGLSKKDADAAIKAFQSVVLNDVKSGNKISLLGFGTFEKIHRDARSCRNPKTGEVMGMSSPSDSMRLKVSASVKKFFAE